MKSIITLFSLSIFLIIIPVTNSIAQNRSSEPVNERDNSRDSSPGSGEESFQFMTGYSKHGSGDMKGIVFGAEYWKSLDSRFSLGIMLRSTINSIKHTIIFNNTTTGTVTDASVRFTTAGVQLGPIGSYSFVSNARNKLGIGLGVFGRYQSASNGSDGYAILLPPVTNYPGALIEYYNTTPQHTFSVGGLLQLQYQYFFNDRIFAGLVAGFQTDTNGDALPQAGLVIGKRFRRS